MLDYRNILRVSSAPDKSIRTMELELRSSHHTIRKVQEAAQKAGISWPLSDTVTNEMLMELLFPEEYQKTALYAIPDYAYIHTELARKGTNLTIWALAKSILTSSHSLRTKSKNNLPKLRFLSTPVTL